MFSSCAKDGEDGAIGPPGPQGEQGLPGMDGADGQDGADTPGLLISTSEIINAVTGAVLGKSTLYREENGIFVNYEVSGLEPNYAYTLWWTVWNQPQNCIVPGECGLADFENAIEVEVELMNASGGIIGEDGAATFTSYLDENDNSGSINEDIFGIPTFNGLQNAIEAQVTVVLRSHGPVVPELVAEQINSHQGGCTNNFAPFSEIPDAEGECGDIIFAIHSPGAN
ncbi:MAG: hypothetical protein WBG90_17310 [Saonia sp.]